MLWMPGQPATAVLVVAVWLFGVVEYVNYFVMRLSYPWAVVRHGGGEANTAAGAGFEFGEQVMAVSHPIMFDEGDPLLARVRDIALALPEAQEKISHGRAAFFTQKVFAYYSGSLKADGEWVQHPRSIVVQADTAEREVLQRMPGAYVPAYLGVAGWTGLDLNSETEWELVHELIEESYRVTAPARFVALLDEPDPA